MSDFLLVDGFGNLADGAHVAATDRSPLGSQWTGYSYDFVLTDRSDGRKWLSVATSRKLLLTSKNLGGISTVAICFRVYRGNATASGFLQLYSATGLLGNIGINGSGSLVYSTDTSGIIGNDVVATSTDTIPEDTETFCELRITLGDSGGSVAFYLNGVHSNTVSSIDTKASTGRGSLQYIVFGSCFEVSTTIIAGWKFSDIIIHTAASPIGDVGVYYRPVDADGADTDFTPSAGSDNYAMVDEIGPDEDTTHNESDGTAGHRDSFETAGITNLDILSVGVMVRARKTDTGAATLLLGAIHGASEDQSAAKALTEDYLTLTEFFDVCPSTSAAWSAAEVTAAELSYEVGA